MFMMVLFVVAVLVSVQRHLQLQRCNIAVVVVVKLVPDGIKAASTNEHGFDVFVHACNCI